jgi:hypothetical protein
VAEIGRSGFDAVCYPYPFVEKMISDQWTLFKVFTTVLSEKNVLVVSPFERSIQCNFFNRHRFFKDYCYPEFTLRVCPGTLLVPA